MLGYFPKLYPDEILYSWFARYCYYSGNNSSKLTMKELFNNRNSVSVLDLPINLGTFYNNILHFTPPSLESLIEYHTFYKFYTFFQNKEIKVKTKEGMIVGTNPGALHLTLGVVASNIKEWEFIRYCPECMEENKKEIGECYWSLHHQLPKNFYCLKHNERLLNSRFKARSPQKHNYFHAGENIIGENHCNQKFTDKTEKHLEKISQELLDLMESKISISSNEIQKVYKYLLQLNNYANYFGKVDQAYLAEQFISFYGEELLFVLDSEVNIENDSCWLKSITRKHRKAFHPIRHILFLNFFSIGIRDIEGIIDKEYRPFGEAPYYCLNPAANHYQERVIEEDGLVITLCSDTRLPVGTFSCNCGFVYSRRGPDNVVEDGLRLGRIKGFGEVWMSKLKILIDDQNLTFNAAAKVLKCDPVTVKKYYQKGVTKAKKDNVSVEKITTKREEWMRILQNNPNVGITSIRKNNTALYAWLYHNDLEWLRDNSPRQLSNYYKNIRVDWSTRDKETLKNVILIVRELYAIEKPVFVNKSRIGKKLGNLSLIEKNIDKIPNTKKFIEEAIETREEYQVRLIKWACKEVYYEHRESIEAWRVINKAGIRPNINNNLKKILEKEIEFYNKKVDL